MRLGPRNSRDFWGRCVSEGNKLMTTVTKEQLQELLTQLPPDAKIELETKPSGEINVGIVVEEAVVNGNYRTKEDILKEEYSDLLNCWLTLSEAAKKYDVPRATLSSWIYRANYIEQTKGSYPMTINEAEVAYCVDIYQERRAIGSKAPLLDENGLPYELKHPSIAQYRKDKKSKNLEK